MPLDSLDIPEHLYFTTTSIIKWVPLFNKSEYSQVILDSFAFYRKRKDILLFTFVIMSTHLHFIIKPLNISIGEFLRSFGSYTAQKILEILKTNDQNEILGIFRENRRNPHTKYSVWQEIFSENIFSQKILKQKMEYIHQNPLARDDVPAADRSEYLLSSACFYDKSEQPILEIDDINEFLASE